MGTRGWIGGVSRRAILSIRPETFFRAVSETSVKLPRSLSHRLFEDLHTGRGFVKVHIAFVRAKCRVSLQTCWAFDADGTARGPRPGVLLEAPGGPLEAADVVMTSRQEHRRVGTISLE